MKAFNIKAIIASALLASSLTGCIVVPQGYANQPPMRMVSVPPVVAYTERVATYQQPAPYVEAVAYYQHAPQYRPAPVVYVSNPYGYGAQGYYNPSYYAPGYINPLFDFTVGFGLGYGLRGGHGGRLH